MPVGRSLLTLALGVLPAGAVAGDYLGILRLPESSLTRSGVYSFTTPANAVSLPSFAIDGGTRVKLGYKYSRYLAVEGEYVDFGRDAANPFASPGNLSSQFRSTGFGIDTVAMLPLWRFSFYGRAGAYRGDVRGFGINSTALLPAEIHGRTTRTRFGMGVRYDFTRAFGVRAEMERHSALGHSLTGEGEAPTDQVSVGVSWRF